MQKVSKDEFYSVIAPKDVVLSTIGNYPYTTEFSLRHGGLIGKAVDRYATEADEPCDFEVVTDYYLTK